MIPINKTIRPARFDEWKRENAQNIKTWIADTNLSANDIWAKLPESAKRDLQETLLRQQGYVCCYCGSRIETNTIEIEHFLPKSIFREQIFEYDNLFACCFGGTRETKHKVKEGETLDSIAELYDCSIETIMKYEYDSNLNKQVAKPINDSIHEGNELFISPVKEQKHCGNTKANQELAFDLKENNLSLYFAYKVNGQVTSNKSSIQNDIEKVLFLNEENLIRLRKNQIMAYSEWFKSVTKDNLNKQQTTQLLQKQRTVYLKKDNEKKHLPFYFVLLHQIDKIH